MKNLVIFCLVSIGFCTSFFLHEHASSILFATKPLQEKNSSFDCGSTTRIHLHQLIEDEVTHILKKTFSYLHKYKPAPPVVPIEDQWFMRRWERKNSIASLLSDSMAHLVRTFVGSLV